MDVKSPTLFGNLVVHLRFSNYLHEEKIGKHIMGFRQYYNVSIHKYNCILTHIISCINLLGGDKL